jgi:hypothetical protein
VEKDALRPLPAKPFVLATRAKAKISPDILAQGGEGAVLGVLARHRQGADVRFTVPMAQFFMGGKLVKARSRKALGAKTGFGNYAPEDEGMDLRKDPMWDGRCEKEC